MDCGRTDHEMYSYVSLLVSERRRYSFSIRLSISFCKHQCVSLCKKISVATRTHLDGRHFRFESVLRLLQHFSNQLLMMQHFARLHHAHNAGLRERIHSSDSNTNSLCAPAGCAYDPLSSAA